MTELKELKAAVEAPGREGHGIRAVGGDGHSRGGNHGAVGGQGGLREQILVHRRIDRGSRDLYGLLHARAVDSQN